MTEDLINRITYHLSSGGLFNPELADHLAVRNLLMECREALANVATNDTSQERVDKTSESVHESVTWGVDWGRAGDIPCVSIIKRLPDGGIKVMAVEYAPYSYTSPQQRTWVGLTLTQVKLLWEGVQEEAIQSGDSVNWVFYTHINEALKEKNS